VLEAIFSRSRTSRTMLPYSRRSVFWRATKPSSAIHALLLLRKRGPNVVPFLARALSGADADVRKLILDVLAGVDGPGAPELYRIALADSELNVVITAVECLSNARKPEFRERIEELAVSSDPMPAGACLEALSRIGNSQSLRAIRAHGPVPEFLLPSYLKPLGSQGDGQAIAEAVEMLDTRGARLRTHVLDAIARLHQRHPTADLPESLIEPLKAELSESGSAFRRLRWR
jgi:HEAT repeat protein